MYVAYPLLTVSEHSAGGAEQMLWTLEREMAGRGIHTNVAASAGSQVSGQLFVTGAPCSLPDDFERRNREHQDRIVEFIHARARQGRAFDLVHDISGSLWPRAREIDAPVLSTLHLPRHFYFPQFFEDIPVNVAFNCVSESQARSFAGLNPAVIPNGICLEFFQPAMSGRRVSPPIASTSRLHEPEIPFNPHSGHSDGASRARVHSGPLSTRRAGRMRGICARVATEESAPPTLPEAAGRAVMLRLGCTTDLLRFCNEHEPLDDQPNRGGLLWLGRICEEKAPHLALEIASRACRRLTLAGQVYPFSYHQQYFERELAPRLQQMPNAIFISSPTAGHKRQLLRDSKAVVITSQVEETSSLVAMEAAASGTPVIAFRRGALAEIVRDGVTGFLVDGIEEAVEALKRIAQISPADCIHYAQKNFSSVRMADGYQGLYAEIMEQTASVRPQITRSTDHQITRSR